MSNESFPGDVNLLSAELLNPETAIEQEVADKRATRESIATTYALAMGASRFSSVDFARINRAILGRYKPSGLAYIKDRAWRIIKGQA